MMPRHCTFKLLTVALWALFFGSFCGKELTVMCQVFILYYLLFEIFVLSNHSILFYSLSTHQLIPAGLACIA